MALGQKLPGRPRAPLPLSPGSGHGLPLPRAAAYGNLRLGWGIYMSWGFEEGKIYNRRTDIHAKLGGQQQGGIVTPSQHPLVIIITGEEGLAHGYDDRTRADGVFEYFGEGQVGDMVLQRGNLAIAQHAVEGKSLLLFRKTAEGLRFLGEMVYEKHHTENTPDREGQQRDAIVFELRP